MDRRRDLKLLEAGVLAGLADKTVQVPALLLKHYRRLKLSELEAMLLIQIIAFKEAEGTDFPTPEQLQERMSARPEAVLAGLERLVKDGFVEIDERIDPVTDVQYEVYNLEPLMRKLAALRAEELAEEAARAQPPRTDIFSVFEQEFGRPLTPMECETITQWLDHDRFSEQLVLAALKEAVFAGKVHFKYIDRILLDWSRNQVRTVEQAREYAQKFRGMR